MEGDAFLQRSPLVGPDGRHAGQLLSSNRPGDDAPFQPLLAALGDADDSGPILWIDRGRASEVLTDTSWPFRLGMVVDASDHVGRDAQRRRGGPLCLRRDEAGTAAGDPDADVWWWLQAEDLARRATPPGPRRIIAAGVATSEQFEGAIRHPGVHCLQGNWYLGTPAGRPAPVTPAQSTVMELMDLASREAPAPRMERALRRDATLSFRLLRYINSAGFGLSCEIQSLGHAVAILGYRNLSRWLALLLAGTGGTAAAPALVQEAAIRGRLTELLGEAFLDPGERDSLFITGVFSMLPCILKAPMSALLAQLTLPSHITDALTDRSGLHGPLLSLAEAVETPGAVDPDDTAASLGLSPALVNHLHVEAITWAEKLAA
jgi:hypothetical protein